MAQRKTQNQYGVCVCVWGKGEEASLEVARGQVSGVERPLLTSGSGASRPNWPLYRLGSQFPELVSFCRVYSKVASLTDRARTMYPCTLGVSQSRPGEESSNDANYMYANPWPCINITSEPHYQPESSSNISCVTNNFWYQSNQQ